MKRLWIILITLLILGGASAGILWKARAPQKSDVKTSQATPAPSPKEISYKGEAGKTALELLRQNAKAETQGEGANAFVTSINGYKADSGKKEFWAMYVNGKSSDVGAGSYVTQPTDEIMWKIATY